MKKKNLLLFCYAFWILIPSIGSCQDSKTIFSSTHECQEPSKNNRENLEEDDEKKNKDSRKEKDKDNKSKKEKEKPWFTGSLLSLSTTPADVGQIITVPAIWNYLRYARYNRDGKKIKAKSVYSLNPEMRFFTGIAKDWDVGFITSMYQNYHNKQIYTGFGDCSFQVKYILLKETDDNPAITLGVGEIFPTGNYHHLDPEFDSNDGTGLGAYITVMGIRFGKIFIINETNSIRLRYDLRYSIPSSVPIKGSSVYNTGFGADGTAYPGNTFTTDFSFEYHIVKNITLSCDFFFTHTNKTPFKGYPGKTKEGTLKVGGRPSSDLFTLCPALEYNYSAKIGFIAGLWFTVWGRNASAYYCPTISAYLDF
jgi:hypothetical protein